jgi:hypothetical protein
MYSVQRIIVRDAELIQAPQDGVGTDFDIIHGEKA